MAQQRDKKERDDAELVAVIAAAIVIGASAKATATKLAPTIGVPLPSLLPVVIIALSKPTNYGAPVVRSAVASTESARSEALFRAQYVLAASRRVAAATRLGNREKALRDEQRYFNQHMAAMKNRQETAAAVDRAKSRFGDRLGWYAKMDSLTSAECREANGKNFYASQMPPIGYPGAVHPHCRCKPGRAHATSQTVYSVKSRDGKVA